MLDKLAEVAGRLIAGVLAMFTIKRQAEDKGRLETQNDQLETANDRLKDMAGVADTTARTASGRLRNGNRRL